jgi:putative endonuclease
LFQFLFRFFDELRHRRRKRLWEPTRAVGRRGEDLAHRHLRKLGFTVVGRNFRARSGLSELDIIAWENETLVFVEVKARSSAEYGSPERAMDPDKRRKLFRGAREYARSAGVEWSRVRFDIVNVLLSEPPDITHYRDVFSLIREV